MDIDSVLLSVQERDKWRRRHQVLAKSLEEIQDRRSRLRARLRRIKRELSQLAEYSDAVPDPSRTHPATRAIHASSERGLVPR